MFRFWDIIHFDGMFSFGICHEGTTKKARILSFDILICIIDPHKLMKENIINLPHIFASDICHPHNHIYNQQLRIYWYICNFGKFRNSGNPSGLGNSA